MLARLRSFPVALHVRTFRAASVVCAAAVQPKPAPAADDGTNRAHFSSTRFADVPISARSKMAIPHEYLSDVQEATLELGLSGADLLVQAKTGTGKTMAFLLPAIEQLAKKPLPRSGRASILVLSPTRELAMQIEKEAYTLLRKHPFRVQALIGGTSIEMQKRRLNTQRCDILVATPGRLLDLLQSTHMAERLSSIQTVVLDEADRLLDVGFKDTLNSIFDYLPDRDQNPRQCMLYSATLSREVKEIAALYLSPNHKFVSTLAEDEVNTHEHVPQSCVTVPISDTMKAAVAVLQDDVAQHGNSSKSMVFCTTAWGTSATARLLRDAGHGKLPRVYEIHSRMTQNRRLAVAQDFKRAKSAILVTSDVTARGMDFPGVTLVVQIGLPSSSEQYIHRLGRTARAGRSGRGIIILTPHESGFLRTRDMRALPIQSHPKLELPSIPPAELDRDLQIQAYSAWLGFNSQFTRQAFRSRQQFVDEAAMYARDVLGWADDHPPPISPRTALNLGIQNLAQVNTGSYKFDGYRQSSSRSHSPSRRSSWEEDGSSDRPYSRAPRRPPHQDTEERSPYRRADGRPHRWLGRGRVRKENSWNK